MLVPRLTPISPTSLSFHVCSTLEFCSAEHLTYTPGYAKFGTLSATPLANDASPSAREVPPVAADGDRYLVQIN
jgi:hypothetical protein